VASDYPPKIVLIGFFFQEQNAGTADERQQFSDDIHRRFDRHIVDACTEAGLPHVSEEARAIMAVMAQNAPGSASKTKAGKAVKAYLDHRGR
jgi:hypothetical protein